MFGVIIDSFWKRPEYKLPPIQEIMNTSNTSNMSNTSSTIQPIYYIYILLLIENKIYVGETKTADFHRIDAHFNNQGSAWTKIYKPIKVLSIYKTNIPYLESSKFLEMVEKYGIENVRGNIYSRTKLNSLEYLYIEKMLRNKKGTCLSCNSKDHYITNCHGKMQMKLSTLENDLKKIEQLSKNLEIDKKFKELNIPFESPFDYRPIQLEESTNSANFFTLGFTCIQLLFMKLKRVFQKFLVEINNKKI